MPRRNRVTPYGELVAVPDRGLFWGNRGSLLDQAGRLARASSTRAWVICLLEFHGRRRTQWVPGRLTEVYFLDEATGLAAGHRPCGECRHHDHLAFKAAWTRAHGGGPWTAPAIDARLHADRWLERGVRRTYRASLAELPDGVVVEEEGRPWLHAGGRLLAWTPGGYAERRRAGRGATVTVLTPRATVATIAAGYRPILHPSAGS